MLSQRLKRLQRDGIARTDGDGAYEFTDVDETLRVVTEWRFRDHERRIWLTIEESDVSVCLEDPCLGIDVYVDGYTVDLYRVYAGRISLEEAIGNGTVTPLGNPGHDRWASAERHDHDGTFVQEGFEHLRNGGFLSMLVPSELGGGGATHAEASAVLACLAHGCPATALAFSMHSHLVALRSGATIAVSPPRCRHTWRRRTSCSRRTTDHPLHHSVPNAGISIDETWDALGMRGTGSHTVLIEHVFVPDEAVALIRPADVWHPVWSVVVGAALPLIMATYVGVAESAARRVKRLFRDVHGATYHPLPPAQQQRFTGRVALQLDPVA